MEFKVISGVSEAELKSFIRSMVSDDFELNFTSDSVTQSYGGNPLTICIQPRNGYIKVSTSLENGWPFLKHVIQKQKLTAMSIRFVENSIAEFSYWVEGELIRMQHALRDSNWIWYGKGELQEWENVSQYSNRLVKDRLTLLMLESYLEKCGYAERLVE